MAEVQPGFATLSRITSGKPAELEDVVRPSNGANGSATSVPTGRPDAPRAPQSTDGSAAVPSSSQAVDTPHGLPAVIRDAMRKVSNRRTLSIESNVHKDFENGDCYRGSWQAGLPQGQGIYTWADGSVYEGEWQVPPSFKQVLFSLIHSALCVS